MTSDRIPSVYQRHEIHQFFGDHHHQIGNSFQTLLSFIRLRMRRSQTLSHQDMEAIVLYLTLLSTLHANLGEKALEGILEGSLPFDTVVNQLLDEWSSRVSQVKLNRSIDSLQLSPKKVMNTGAIVVALLASNLVKGSQALDLSLSVPEDGPPSFKMVCALTYADPIDTARMQEDPNLMLASTLCKANNNSDLVVDFVSATQATWKFEASY